MITIILIVIVLGLVIGSFLNVCICRIPNSKSISYPPSHCYNCNINLQFFDLIPIFSYIFLKGRCRYCNCKISLLYPTIELLNCILYIIFYLRYGFSVIFIKYIIICSILIVISVIDYKIFIIPDNINIFLVIISLTINIYMKTNVLDMILGFLFGFGFFYLLLVLSKGNMGGGDVKLMGAIGIALGIKSIVLITFLSFIIACILCLFFIIIKLKNKKDSIAFGPFIAISTIIAMYSKAQIINWYLKYFIL